MVLPADPHLHLLLHDGEDPLDAEADAHAGHRPAFGVEHAHKAVVAAATRHASHAHSLLCFGDPRLCWGVRHHARLGEYSFVDDACVVVQPPGQAQIEQHLDGEKKAAFLSLW